MLLLDVDAGLLPKVVNQHCIASGVRCWDEVMTVIERSWNIAGISHINDTWVGRPSVLKWQQVHLGDGHHP